MTLTKSLSGLCIILAVCASLASGQVNITTWDVDLTHSGVNPNETMLTPTNVALPGGFGLLFTQTLDGQTYGQILYASNVNVSGVTHNLIYVTTEHDSLYAFDADSNAGANSNPIWHDNFIPTGATTVPGGDVNSGDITVEIGITTTPVIDLSSSTIYVISKVKTTAARTDNTGSYAAGTYQIYLHALDMTTGAEKFNGPVLINPIFTGTANYNNTERTATGVNGPTVGANQVPFNALRQHSRAAMTLYNGTLYLCFASHGDQQPYHGVLLGYNPTTLQQTASFISTPNGTTSAGEGGIWGAGAGPAIDSNGTMYVTTGNGAWGLTAIYGTGTYTPGGTINGTISISGITIGNPTTNPIVITTSAPHGLTAGQTITISGVNGVTGGNGSINGTVIVDTVPTSTTLTVALPYTDWSESIVKLPSSGTGALSANYSDPTTFFTPTNYASLTGSDLDLGSSGVVLLPDQTGGTHPHLMMGGGKGSVMYVVDRDAPGGVSAGLQEIPESNGGFFETPAYFNGNVYYAGSGGPLEQRAVGYNATTGNYISPTATTSTETYPIKGAGCFITANGTSNGLVWMVNTGSTLGLTGALMVHNAANVSGNPIYTFTFPNTGSGAPVAATKFDLPTVANGKAYVTGFDTSNVGHLFVLGILQPATSLPSAPTGLTASPVSGSEISLSWTNTATNESGFQIERATSLNGTYNLVTTIGSNAAASSTVSYTDTGLTPNTAYYYQVYATNSLGNSTNPSNTASTKTLPVYNPTGLVAYWPFDEGGGTTANDITGNGHTGTANGEYNWTTGIDNYAINFHGTGTAESSVSVPNTSAMQFSATQSFTISAWVNPEAFRGAEEAIIAKSADQGNEYGLYINANHQWVFRGPAGDIVGPTVVDGVWTHVAGVQDGVLGTRSLYVNGVIAGTGIAQAADGAGDFWIGQQNLIPSNPDSYDGIIDEVRLYNVPLPPNQVPDLLGPPVLQAVSNVTQGSAGTFGVTIEPETTPAIEPREGSPVGAYNIVMTFSAPVSGIGASLTLQNGRTAVGTVGTITYDPTNMVVTVPLTGVGNAQTLNLHLTGIQPGNGTADIPFDVLWGDVSGDGIVDSPDTTLVNTNLGLTLTSANATCDINCDGVIDSNDLAVITNYTGTFIGTPGLTNLALGGTASGSSYQTGNGYSNGNDNNLNTRWAANGATFPSYWQVDLGSVDSLTQAVIYWFSDTTRAYSYNIEVSSTDPNFGTGNYTTVANHPNNTTFANTTDNFTATGRYVRITITAGTAGGGYPSAYEFQIYGYLGSGTAPVISTQPKPQLVSAGQQVTFSVGLSGNGPVTYQWQKGGVNIYGATGSTFTIPSASATYSGNYSVVITNAYGTVTSNSFALTVVGASPSDTPTMPFWALVTLALLLLGLGQRFLASKPATAK